MDVIKLIASYLLGKGFSLTVATDEFKFLRKFSNATNLVQVTIATAVNSIEFIDWLSSLKNLRQFKLISSQYDISENAIPNILR